MNFNMYIYKVYKILQNIYFLLNFHFEFFTNLEGKKKKKFNQYHNFILMVNLHSFLFMLKLETDFIFTFKQHFNVLYDHLKLATYQIG